MTKRQREILKLMKRGATARLVAGRHAGAPYYVISKEGQPNQSAQCRTIDALKAAKEIRPDDHDKLKLVINDRLLRRI